MPSYRLSSFAHYWEGKAWHAIKRESLLSQFGLPDTKAGMRKYLESLRNREEGMPRKAQELAKYYCWGWYQGSAEGKRALAKKVAAGSEVTDWEGVDRRELNEARWEAVVVEELKARGIAESEIVESPKGAYWKVEITLRLRAETTASNPWIAERLHMGHPSRITNLLRSVAS